MKSYPMFWLMFIGIILFAGCQKVNEKTVHVTTESVKESSIIANESQLLNQNFMLIQAGSAEFPQSQGIFDIQKNKMTIVKQYVPTDNPNITKEYELKANAPQESHQVAEDVSNTFPGKQYDANPYKVYEIVIEDITVKLVDRQLVISGANHYQQIFVFQNAENTQVKDRNGVFYDVRTSK